MSSSLWPHGLHSPWNSPGQNTGEGSLSLLQGIFPTQGLSPGLPHCRRILYQLSHKGSPRIPEWVAYTFSSRSSQPGNLTGVSCIAGGFFFFFFLPTKLSGKPLWLKGTHAMASEKPRKSKLISLQGTWYLTLGFHIYCSSAIQGKFPNKISITKLFTTLYNYPQTALSFHGVW